MQKDKPSFHFPHCTVEMLSSPQNNMNRTPDQVNQFLGVYTTVHQAKTFFSFPPKKAINRMVDKCTPRKKKKDALLANAIAKRPETPL
jgi:hypothetical protein